MTVEKIICDSCNKEQIDYRQNGWFKIRVSDSSFTLHKMPISTNCDWLDACGQKCATEMVSQFLNK